MRRGAGKQDALDALGNPYRREIVAMLARKPRSVQEIADRLPISRPAVSRHLRVLNGAGIVSDEQLGARRLYRVDRAYLTRVWSDQVLHRVGDQASICGAAATGANAQLTVIAPDQSTQTLGEFQPPSERVCFTMRLDQPGIGVL